MRKLKRIYKSVLEEHLRVNRQMLFLVGPRQVEKTTLSLEVSEPYKDHYFIFNELGKYVWYPFILYNIIDDLFF